MDDTAACYGMGCGVLCGVSIVRLTNGLNLGKIHTMTRILVATDGSASSMDAVRHCIGLVSNGLRATVVLGHVQEEASFLELATQNPDAIAQAAMGAGKSLMAPAVIELQAMGIPFEQEVALGDPAAAVVDMAERLQCDFIVIGARGMGALQRAFMGSVSQSVLHHSRMPVTVVRAQVDAAMDVLGETGAQLMSDGVTPLSIKASL